MSASFSLLDASEAWVSLNDFVRNSSALAAPERSLPASASSSAAQSRSSCHFWATSYSAHCWALALASADFAVWPAG